MKTTMIILEVLEADTNKKYAITYYLANGEKLKLYPTGETFQKIEKCYQTEWKQINQYTKVAIL